MLFELFECCCRKHSQYGVGEVLIPLRHCWPDAFSVQVCVGSGSFCHDWASHCSVLFWSLMHCFFLGSSGCVQTLNAATLRVVLNIIRLKNNSICLKPNESFVYIGEEVRFHNSSRFCKKAGDAKLWFYHSFVPVLMSLAAESCRSRAESVHLLKHHLQWGKR